MNGLPENGIPPGNTVIRIHQFPCPFIILLSAYDRLKNPPVLFRTEGLLRYFEYFAFCGDSSIHSLHYLIQVLFLNIVFVILLNVFSSHFQQQWLFDKRKYACILFPIMETGTPSTAEKRLQTWTALRRDVFFSAKTRCCSDKNPVCSDRIFVFCGRQCFVCSILLICHKR